MRKTPDYDNAYMLCSDGKIFCLLDTVFSELTIQEVVEQLTKEHGDIVKVASTPLKFFDQIIGIRKDGVFVPFGPTNWSNLFMIHGDFTKFLAWIGQKLVAWSTTGVFWQFNIIDA